MIDDSRSRLIKELSDGVANRNWYYILILVIRGVRDSVLSASNLTVFFELFAAAKQKKHIDLLYCSLERYRSFSIDSSYYFCKEDAKIPALNRMDILYDENHIRDNKLLKYYRAKINNKHYLIKLLFFKNINLEVDLESKCTITEHKQIMTDALARMYRVKRSTRSALSLKLEQPYKLFKHFDELYLCGINFYGELYITSLAYKLINYFSIYVCNRVPLREEARNFKNTFWIYPENDNWFFSYFSNSSSKHNALKSEFFSVCNEVWASSRSVKYNVLDKKVNVDESLDAKALYATDCIDDSLKMRLIKSMSFYKDLAIVKWSEISVQNQLFFKKLVTLVLKTKQKYLKTKLANYAVLTSLQEHKVIPISNIVSVSTPYMLFSPIEDNILSLKNFMYDQKQISINLQFTFAIDIADAMSFLHNENNINGVDLSPDNILIQKGHAYILDYLSRSSQNKNIFEVYEKQKLSMIGLPLDKLDVFNYGLLLFMIMSKNISDDLDEINGYDYSRHDQLLVKVLFACLSEVAADRPSFSSIVCMLNRQRNNYMNRFVSQITSDQAVPEIEASGDLSSASESL